MLATEEASFKARKGVQEDFWCCTTVSLGSRKLQPEPTMRSCHHTAHSLAFETTSLWSWIRAGCFSNTDETPQHCSISQQRPAATKTSYHSIYNMATSIWHFNGRNKRTTKKLEAWLVHLLILIIVQRYQHNSGQAVQIKENATSKYQVMEKYSCLDVNNRF